MPTPSPTLSPVPQPFAYWREALAGRLGPVHENDPQPGYYRTRPGKGYRARAVAIWRGPEGMQALRDGFPVDAGEIWTWCCRNPIPYETYVAVAERGEPWPEEVEAPGVGHNSAAAADEMLDPAERLGAEIAVVWRVAKDWLADIGAIADQVTADKAANYAETFGALEKTAEEGRTAEKKPVLEQGRAIDAKWKPVIGAADEAKRAMKKALEPFLIAESKRLADVAGFAAAGESARAGTGGRRIALRRTRRLTVSDHQALIGHYRRDARLFEDEGVQKALMKLAEIDLLAGRKVPGANLVEEQVAA